MSFSGKIKAFADKAVKDSNKTVKGTALSLFSRIIKDTPVDSGRLTGNWQTSINTINRDTIAFEGNENSANSFAIDNVLGAIGKYKPDDKVIMSNNLPYATVIENGSKTNKRPAGMVKKNVALYSEILKGQL